MPNLSRLQSIIVEALDDLKARDILVLDTTLHTREFDSIIIATAEVARQTRAMAHHVADKVKSAGGQVVGIEGAETAEWVLVNCIDVVVHIMQTDVRTYYDLEGIWGGNVVKVMTARERAALASAKRKAKKTEQEKLKIEEKSSTPSRTKRPTKDSTPSLDEPAKKAMAKKSTVKKASTKKTVTTQVSSSKRTPLKTSMGDKKPKTATPKTVSKKTSSRPTPKTKATKTVIKKMVLKKTTTRKVPAKKTSVLSRTSKTPASKGIKKTSAIATTSAKTVRNKPSPKGSLKPVPKKTSRRKA